MTEITAKGWEQHAEACRRRLVQGDSAGAEKSFAAALAEGEALGPDSAGLAACLTGLGQIRSQQRDHGSAEILFRRALEVRERAPEFDHTGIIQVLGHLASIHNARADYDEADRLLTRALTLADKHLAPSHPAVASLLNNLARLYFKRADHAKADRMLVRLLQIKQALGTEHPEVAGVLASIAALRSALGKHDVAEQLWRRVLAIREKSLPHNDPAIITTLNSLADACASQGEHEEALHFRERGLRLQAHALGSDHPEVAATRDKAAAERAGTPAQSQPPVTPIERIAIQTPSASLAPPVVPLPSLGVPTPASPVPASAPLSVQQNRITPIPLAPIEPSAPNKVERFAGDASGESTKFAPPPSQTPAGLPGASPGIGGPPVEPPSIAAGIGGPVPTPASMKGIGGGMLTPGSIGGVAAGSSTPASFPGIGGTPPAPPTVVPGFAGPLPAFEAPAPAPPRVVAAPLAPVAPKPAPKAPAPPRRRSEPSVERPRYESQDDGGPAPRRGGALKVLAGLAAAAGIGFAVLTFGRGKEVPPAEAASADSAQAEPRMIRIPAESLRVVRDQQSGSGRAPAITLDSALAASRARNALDSAATLGVAADSGVRPIVVPSPRQLDALSRAVDAGLRPSLDSAFRAPAPKTPDFKAPQ